MTLNQDHAKPAYRSDIDGLRAIAVLAVVLHHAFPEYVRGGFVGVDIFFVLSGYLISTIILAGLEKGKFSLSDFYARRVKRIFPALFLVLVTTLAMGWITLIPNEFKALGKHALAGSAFVSNFAFWFEAGYFDASATSKPLLHLWSLAIEEQFYLFWPFTLYALHRWGRATIRWILVLLTVSLVFNLWLVRHDLNAAFYNPLARFWEMMMGATLAAMHVKKIFAADLLPNRLKHLNFIGPQWLTTAGATLLALVLIRLNPECRFPGWWAFVATLGTCLMIAAGKEGWFNRYVLSSKPMVWIGLISYPLYLWHWPLLSFAHIRNGAQPSDHVQWQWVGASFLLAWLTYLLVERPIRFGVLKNKRFVTLLLCGSIAGTAAAGYAVQVKEGFPGRFPSLLSTLLSKGGRDAIVDGWREDSCVLDFNIPPTAYKPLCVEEKRRPLVFIWGDSHAGSLYPGFKALQDSGKYEFGIGQRAGAICPPVLGIDPRPMCAAINNDTIRVIRETVPEIVILYAWWHEEKVHGRYYDMYKLEATVAEIKKAGVKRIILLGAVPYWKEDLPQILLKVARQGGGIKNPPLRLGEEYLDPWVRAATNEMRARSAAMGIEFISGMDFFCNKQGCLTRMSENASEPLSYDYGHLTVPAVTYYVQRLAPLIFNK
jgi:peptidoglycan/LPS O-acetylase OafA/YrhL